MRVRRERLRPQSNRAARQSMVNRAVRLRIFAVVLWDQKVGLKASAPAAMSAALVEPVWRRTQPTSAASAAAPHTAPNRFMR